MDDMFLPPKKAPAPRVPTQPEAPAPVEPVFTPPQEVAAKEQAKEPTTPINTPPQRVGPPKKASWWKRTSKKKKLIIGIALLFTLIAGGVAAYFVFIKKDPPKKTETVVVEEKVEEPPKPTTVASTLTGLQVDPALNQRGVTAVMIENSMDARPQSGLYDAGVVYEAIAEGGITRFMALFQESQPTYIGPVRSARPYYIDWLMPYSATYAHAGGSPEALKMIKDLKIKDMDHGANGSSYQRVSSRFAPHNLYTSMANLDAIRTKNNWGNPIFTGFTRKAEAPAKVKTATTIDVKISSVNFYSHYEYDTATNSYKRSEGGQPHMDEKAGKQITPKVVVVLVVPYSIHPDGVHSKYQTVGSGQAFVFQDGEKFDATWSKTSQSAVLELKDAGGRVMALNPGQTWITAVGQASMVTFTGPPAPVAGAGQ